MPGLAPANVLLVLQARLASTRLPAKALLPLAGVASVVLSARRAANTGRRVIVATSLDAADDAIVAIAKQADIACYRGSQHDVLERFAGATQSLSGNGVVVRLTADNPFPDGEFVDMLLDRFTRENAEYLGTSSPLDGLPYGMSGEVFTVEALRRAHESATAPADREHVTPWIRRTCRVTQFRHGDAPPYWSRLRCTLDTFDDYRALCEVFNGERHPLHVPWRALVERLADVSIGGREPRCRFRQSPDGRLHSIVTLGTAQLGMQYGIANLSGIPSEEAVAELLAVAADAGVITIDTARAYGASEERIGRLLPGNAIDRTRIVTKLDVLASLSSDAAESTVRSTVENSILTSLQNLRRRRLDAVLLHRPAQRTAWDGATWRRLKEMRDEGVIGDLGVSVSNADEAIDALSDPDVVLMQCPVNVLDHRWREPEFLAAINRRPDVIVHARSPLLQGLLTLPPDRWPQMNALDSKAVHQALVDLQREFGRADLIDLCFAYVAALPWVWSMVIGCETAVQLRENLARIARPALSADQLALVAKRIHSLPERLLDPSQWANTA